MRRFVKDPLLHFMLLGAAIFAGHAWTRTGPAADTQPAIEVSAGQVKQLAEVWQRQWQRRPSENELRAVVEGHVREELLFRQAIALGLEKGDSIIRQRLAQKMQFLSEDIAELAQPDEATLRRFFDQNVASYIEPPVVTFSHVYFSLVRRGAQLDADAKAALDLLARRPDAASELGDPFILPFDFADTSAADVASQFGGEFAAALRDVPAGTWQGPVVSTYGAHLVRVTERTAGRRPELSAVRDAVLRDYQREQREVANRTLLQDLRARYRIAVDDTAIEAAAREEVARAHP
jgi:peptidyl-prolyl cis-trans isomerase C